MVSPTVVLDDALKKVTDGLRDANVSKDTQPKDDPQWVAKYAIALNQIQQCIVIARNCPCPRCNLDLFEFQISEFVCRQTVEAAYTGDTSKLQAVLDLITKMKAAK